MGVREYDYIRGNTALAPERKVQEREINKEKEQERRQRNRQAHNKRKNTLKGLISITSIAILLAIVTLFINGYVYKLQESLTNVEDAYKEQQDINEALKVDMLKYAAVGKVKETAENELGMVYPTEKSTITIDMSKEYFSHIKKQEESKSSLLAKIMKVFN